MVAGTPPFSDDPGLAPGMVPWRHHIVATEFGTWGVRLLRFLSSTSESKCERIFWCFKGLGRSNDRVHCSSIQNDFTENLNLIFLIWFKTGFQTQVTKQRFEGWKDFRHIISLTDHHWQPLIGAASTLRRPNPPGVLGHRPFGSGLGAQPSGAHLAEWCDA